MKKHKGYSVIELIMVIGIALIPPQLLTRVSSF
jgi:hypothetical protein